MKTFILLTVLLLAASVAFARTRTERAYDNGFSDGERAAEVYNGHRCHPRKIIGTGDARLGESRAKQSAINAWMGQVEALYGKTAYSYEIARDKVEKCFSAGVHSWNSQCTVEAYPCEL